MTNDNFGPNLVDGTIHVDGFAKIDNPNGPEAEAVASSISGVTVRSRTQLPNGRIQWGPALMATVHGSASVAIHDPIHFDLIDLVTQEELAGTLLQIESELQGDGSFLWDGGLFQLDASFFDFSIDISSPYTVQQGTVDLKVRNGIITTSVGTGLFANIFPSVGQSGAFSLPLGGIQLDYSLGDFDGHGLDVTFDFNGGGEAAARVPGEVPEPGSLLLLGSCLLKLARTATRRFHS